MKKIIFTILGLLLIMVISGAVVYNNSLSPAGTSKDVVTFEVKSGMTSKEILSELHKDGLIKNEFVSYLYVKHNNINNLQAGTYNLNKGMGLKEIVDMVKGLRSLLKLLVKSMSIRKMRFLTNGKIKNI